VVEVRRERLLDPAEHPTTPEKATFHTWAIHAQEFEERHVKGDWTAGSTRFPPEMVTILAGEQ
jgi:hypothetical protein